jgi:hypothetical protein
MTGGQAILLSQDWVYNNILEMSDDEIEVERKKILEDMKRQQEQQTAVQPPMDQGAPPEGGAPPAEPPPEEAPPEGEEGQEAQIDDVDQILASLEATDEDEENPELEEALAKNKGGRPYEGLKFGTDRHPLGRDPLGHKENKKAVKRTLSGETKNFLESLQKKGISKYKQFLSESLLSDDKIEG